MVEAWKIAPGEGAEDWDVCREKDCIGLGWMELPTFNGLNSEEAVLKALKTAYRHDPKGNREGAARAIYRFRHEVEPGHLVVANEGLSCVAGVGVVTSGYLAPHNADNPIRNDSRIKRRHARCVKWYVVRRVEFGKTIFARDAVHSLSPERREQIKQAYLKQHPKLKGILNALFGGKLIPSGLPKKGGAEDLHPVQPLSAKDRALLPNGASKAAEAIDRSAGELDEDGAFDPNDDGDARNWVVKSIAQRQGQPEFRKKLLRAYGGRCAISGCTVAAVLEAAHILSYRGAKTNHCTNGILLRADLHTLFDRRLIAIDSKTMRVLVSPALKGTEYEKAWAEQQLNLPKDKTKRPNKQVLDRQRKEAGF